MKPLLLASAMLLLASWARADSIPQCPVASLSFYDTSLPDGCLSYSGRFSPNFWSNFSSPMTADPSLITVSPECIDTLIRNLPVCGFLVSGGAADNIPNLDFRVVLGNGVAPVGAFNLYLCGGPTGATADGSAIFNGQVVSTSVTSPSGDCDMAGQWGFGIDNSDTVESWAKIDSGSGTVSYFVGVGPEPGTMVLLGGGLAVLASRRRKLRRPG